jgi:hypothetical protein
MGYPLVATAERFQCWDLEGFRYSIDNQRNAAQSEIQPPVRSSSHRILQDILLCHIAYPDNYCSWME